MVRLRVGSGRPGVCRWSVERSTPRRGIPRTAPDALWQPLLLKCQPHTVRLRRSHRPQSIHQTEGKQDGSHGAECHTRVATFNARHRLTGGERAVRDDVERKSPAPTRSANICAESEQCASNGERKRGKRLSHKVMLRAP